MTHMRHMKKLLPLLGAAALSAGLLAQGSVLATEKSKLRVMVNGAKAAEETYSISPSGGGWLAVGNMEISTPEGSAKVSSRLQLSAQGLPQRYEWSMEGGGTKRAGSVQFEGGTASIEVRVDDSAPFTEQFFFESPRVVILDNNLYHHYAVLARLYDRKQKGTQTFQVYIPQDRTPGTVTVESLGEQDTSAGKIEHLRVRTPDLEIDVYVDKNGLVRLAVPSANVVIEQE